MADQPLSKKCHKMSTGLQGQKIMYTTLLWERHAEKILVLIKTNRGNVWADSV